MKAERGRWVDFRRVQDALWYFPARLIIKEQDARSESALGGYKCRQNHPVATPDRALFSAANEQPTRTRWFL